MTVLLKVNEAPPKERASASELVLQPRESMKTLQLYIIN